MKIIYNKNENIIFYTERIKFKYVFFRLLMSMCERWPLEGRGSMPNCEWSGINTN